MYAIVDIAGQQYKVEKDKKLFVHRLEGDAGSEISFDKVLLIENEGKISIGDPVIKDAAVLAKVLEHVKGDKVLVFKKKRRKGYRKLNGHRQYLTRIEITEINEKAAEEKKEAAPKAAAKKPAAEQKAGATPKTATAAAPKADTEKKPATKKASTAKKPAAKKPAAKNATEKKPVATKSAAAPKKPSAKKNEGGEKAADKE